MKIKTTMLSKDALVRIVNVAIEKGALDEKALPVLYRHDLTSQLQGTLDQLTKIEKQLENKRLSRKDRGALVGKYNRLSVSGRKKLSLLEQLDKELDNATN